MDSLYEIIINDLTNEVSNIKLYTDELYGYRGSLPEYRIFKRKLYVDLKDTSGTIKKNVLLERPSKHPQNLNFDSLVTLHLNTGLLYLPNELNEILMDELESCFYNVIESIFDCEFEVISARMEINQKSILRMYEEIINRFDIVEKFKCN